jgi:hypothetical protein
MGQPGVDLGQPGVNLGSTMGQPGVDLGQPGVNLESTWGQPGVNLGSTWGQPGVNPGSSCTALPRAAEQQHGGARRFARRGVAAKVEIKSRFRKRFITFWFQALKPGRFHTGFNWFQPAPLYCG